MCVEGSTVKFNGTGSKWEFLDSRVCIRMSSDSVNNQTMTKSQIFLLSMAAPITEQLKAEDLFLPMAC